MIKDRNIAWNTRKKFFACQDMAGVLAGASLGGGAPDMAEVLAAADITGLLCAAAGDEVDHLFPLPWDFDRNSPVRFRVWFTHGSTDADDPDFVVCYKSVAKQDAVSKASSTPDEAVAIPAHTCSTTDDSLEITDWVTSVSDTKIASADLALQLTLECNGLGSAGATEIHMLGVEMEYAVGACLDSNTRDLPDMQPA